MLCFFLDALDFGDLRPLAFLDLAFDLGVGLRVGFLEGELVSGEGGSGDGGISTLSMA